MATRKADSTRREKKSNARALPPLSVWNTLADEFRALSRADKYDDLRTSEAFTVLELRAGKLLATFLEHGRRPVGWTQSTIDGSMRTAVDVEDNATAWPPGWTPGVVGTGLRIGDGITEPKLRPIFGATFHVEVAWMDVAFWILPKRYPDSFTAREPSTEHPLTLFQMLPDFPERDTCRARAFRDRAKAQAEACALLAAPDTWDTKQRREKQRRRGTPVAERRPTDRQLEAIQQYGMCNGNFTKMAKQMGIDRSTAKQHYRAGQRKVGPDVAKKLNPRRLGSVDHAEDGDRGPLPGMAGRPDPLRHHARNGG